MHVTDLYDKAPYDPEDPNPWLALYLDMSLPLSDEVKAALCGTQVPSHASSRCR
jgi:hypothetical protein